MRYRVAFSRKTVCRKKSLTLPAGLVAQLEEAADAAKMSFTEYVRILLVQALETKGAPRI